MQKVSLTLPKINFSNSCSSFISVLVVSNFDVREEFKLIFLEKIKHFSYIDLYLFFVKELIIVI